MRLLLLALAVASALAAPASTSASGRLVVFAASSLTEVFPRIDRSPRYSFGGSDQLALQIRQGAPADVYATAKPSYAELLYRARLLRKPVAFATNRLVVVVPRANPGGIRSVYDLRRKRVKVVIADETVPIGAYTRQILDRLGITRAVLANVVSEENDVKGIVAKVALREADAGFVYATDARAAASRLRPVGLPAWAQPRIRYEIAVVRSTRRAAAARAFIRRVVSTPGRLELRRAGFGRPKR